MEGNGILLTIASLFVVSFAMKAAAFSPQLLAAGLLPHAALRRVGAVRRPPHEGGIYALIRVVLMLFRPERGGLGVVIAWMAALTMLFGALGALAQSDLRRMLNYAVITASARSSPASPSRRSWKARRARSPRAPLASSGTVGPER